MSNFFPTLRREFYSDWIEHSTSFRLDIGNFTEPSLGKLLKLTDDIREGMDSKYVALLMLFDFSKAFDSVNHVVLLRKLRQAGSSVTAIKWIASYLTDREQAFPLIKWSFIIIYFTEYRCPTGICTVTSLIFGVHKLHCGWL